MATSRELSWNDSGNSWGSTKVAGRKGYVSPLADSGLGAKHNDSAFSLHPASIFGIAVAWVVFLSAKRTFSVSGVPSKLSDLLA